MMTGKTVLITGGSSGIGLETAKYFAKEGAHTILAVRNISKGNIAADSIRANYPHSKIDVIYIELSDLETIKNFAVSFLEQYSKLDILINNAGLFLPPRQLSKEGYELQFATNHLGHFALTGLLLPLIIKTPGSRVVTVSSIAARNTTIDFNNLNAKKGYVPFRFYSISKYSNLLFGKKLDLLLKERGHNTKSIICHPGVSATNLISRGSGKTPLKILSWGFKLVGQPAARGAMCTIFAATSQELKGGELIGPNSKRNWRGKPVISDEIDKLYNSETANKLWELSSEITKVEIDIL